MFYLEIDRLSAFYGKAQALTDITITVQPGEIVAVVGPNGAGKSTLLDSIMGLVRTEGEIRLKGHGLTGRPTSEIVRSGVGYAPERFNLFPYMSVRDNLMVGAYTAREDIQSNLEVVHKLFPALLERAGQETSTQSGGERQMVSLGRALMTSPELLLVDEPTIGLAPKICLEIAEVVRRLNREYGLAVVITEQNANFALSLASRIYVLESGRMQTSGTADELRNDARLLEAYFGGH